MYYCYILINSNNHTYVGSTNNLARRLRQHNGEIVGGAKSTRGKGPWRFLFTVRCEDETQANDHNLNLSIEWHLRNPVHKTAPQVEKRKYWGPEGRKKSFEKCKENPKFAHVKFLVQEYE